MNNAVVYIFSCSPQTYAKCMEKQLFGSPPDHNWVYEIKPGDICLLYNTTTHQIQGIWEATSSGQANIDATVWNGKYPNQVRVKQRSQQIQPIPKDLVKGIVTGDKGQVLNILKGENAQSLLKLFSPDNEEEVLPSIPLVQEERDYRNKFSAKFLCADGHRVRSLSEKTIDDWLAHRRIFHSYEPFVFMADPADQLIPDFRIHDRSGSPIYIEYWGRDGDPEYQRRMKRKQEIYKRYSKSLIELTFNDLETLDSVMHKHFQQYHVPMSE